MKFTAFPKTVFCLALLLCWGNCAPPVTADQSSQQFFRNCVAVAHFQVVEAHTPRGSYTANFASVAIVYRNGAASGFLTLSGPDRVPGHPGGVNAVFADGSVRFLPNGTVERVLLRGRTVEGHPIVVMITPDASEDCLIYTTIGTDVRATWEAQGRIVVNRN